jgi:FAD/FMN-containing dehydrogenase
VEPGSVEDVSKIVRTCSDVIGSRSPSFVVAQIKILGSRRTPFAVKGGGHTGNLGFSSTRGVQIAMARFNDTKFHHEDLTVEAGAGLTWDQVYEVLSPIGVNVLGARRPGIGVGGLTLGGGSVEVSPIVGYFMTSDTCRIFIPDESVRTYH